MKVLLDENLNHALRHLTHEVVTVAYMGWASLKNGELLRTAEESGVEVFLTGDGTLGYEQNLSGVQGGTQSWKGAADSTVWRHVLLQVSLRDFPRAIFPAACRNNEIS